MKPSHYVPQRIEPIGDAPIVFNGVEIARHEETSSTERRGVLLIVYETDRDQLIAQMDFLTHEPGELGATYCSGFLAAPEHERNAWPASMRSSRDHQQAGLIRWCHEQSNSVLPPGAGHVVGPYWRESQEKLSGALKSMALHSLSHILGKMEARASAPVTNLKPSVPSRRKAAA